ncbi:hypothetical protein CB1_000069012 [Camelus ferus]|nr:hypothetical protein CB1_000069012 [Camelus ferus]
MRPCAPARGPAEAGAGGQPAVERGLSAAHRGTRVQTPEVKMHTPVTQELAPWSTPRRNPTEEEDVCLGVVRSWVSVKEGSGLARAFQEQEAGGSCASGPAGSELQRDGRVSESTCCSRGCVNRGRRAAVKCREEPPAALSLHTRDVAPGDAEDRRLHWCRACADASSMSAVVPTPTWAASLREAEGPRHACQPRGTKSLLATPGFCLWKRQLQRGLTFRAPPSLEMPPRVCMPDREVHQRVTCFGPLVFPALEVSPTAPSTRCQSGDALARAPGNTAFTLSLTESQHSAGQYVARGRLAGSENSASGNGLRLQPPSRGRSGDGILFDSLEVWVPTVALILLPRPPRPPAHGLMYDSSTAYPRAVYSGDPQETPARRGGQESQREGEDSREPQGPAAPAAQLGGSGSSRPLPRHDLLEEQAFGTMT